MGREGHHHGYGYDLGPRVSQLFSEQFARFNDKTLFGLALEQSNWYDVADPGSGFKIAPSVLQEFEPRFRHLTGLNSGLIRADLNKMRAWNWAEKVWDLYNEVEKQSPGAAHFELGDQDVINVMTQRNPEIVLVMPPETNWQFYYPCADGVDDVYVFHGNGKRWYYTASRLDLGSGWMASDIGMEWNRLVY